jgi:hypothetical protein
MERSYRSATESSAPLTAKIQPRGWGEPQFDQPQPSGIDFSHVDLFSHAPQNRPPARLQMKLTVGEPDDQYEQEADRVAEQVLSMPNAAPLPVQRESSEEDELQTRPLLQRQGSEEEKLQTKPLVTAITPLGQHEAVMGKLIQAKLQGSSEVLQAVGGGGQKWGLIQQQVADYEAAEALQESSLKERDALRPKIEAEKRLFLNKQAEFQQKYPNAEKGKWDLDKKFYAPYQAYLTAMQNAEQAIGAQFHGLTVKLTDLEKAIGVWLSRKSKHRTLEEQKEEPDDFIVQQRQTLEMLLQRVRAEKADLQTRKASNEIGFDRDTVTEVKYEAVGGALNKLDAIKTSTGFEGYFKAEKAIDTEYKKLDNMSGEMELGHPGAESGIPEQNPNFGGRAVAMYRLDQLLGSNVIVKTELATKVINPGGAAPRAEFGIVMEKAKGSGVSKSIKQEGLVQNVDDAMLQRGLSKLQLLDALAGQVDRHQGNYYIQRDASGQVIGVKGIDNDLAFGVGITPEAMTGKGKQIGKYRGMPPVVDKEMALRIINVAPEDVKNALTGLLSEAEVAATLTRLTVLQAELLKLEASGLLKSENEWGAATVADMASGGEMSGGYYAQIKGYSEIAFRDMCKVSLDEAYKKTPHPNIGKALGREYKDAGDQLKQDVMDGVLDPSQVQEVIDVAIDQMVNNPEVSLLSAIAFAESSSRLLRRV